MLTIHSGGFGDRELPPLAPPGDSQRGEAVSAPKATPVPWSFADDGSGFGGCRIDNDAGVEVARVYVPTDAALLCHLANCHADLLAACELAEGLAAYFTGANYDGHAAAAFRALDAAIRKARG